MSFYTIYNDIKRFPIENYLASVTEANVWRTLNKTVQQRRYHMTDFLNLLSPAAETYLEDMAQLAHQLTIQHFGRTMLLFTPIYLSDYCVNKCAYCSFSVDHIFDRKKLNRHEIEQEAEQLIQSGMKHVLIVTGESNQHTPLAYFCDAVDVLKNYFSSLSIEVQPLDTDDYRTLVEKGIDGLVVYQEVYNENVYRDVHIKGPKRNYHYRLDAPERGCQAGMNHVTIGPLLGMDDWRKEAFYSVMHAEYLQSKYLQTTINVSYPRIRPNLGGYEPSFPIQDKQYVQLLLASRLFLPHVGITLSTREHAQFRDHLIPLGITKMSAGSSTAVGGYATDCERESQFHISDERSAGQLCAVLQQKKYQPVFKDWYRI